MNTRMLRTAGAAALGVAFAAAAAGPAAAAALPGPGGALDALPLGKAAKNLPGAAQSTEVTKSTLGTATGMVPATTARTLPLAGGGLPGALPKLPGGGLPTGAVTSALPTGAVPGGLLG